MKESEFTSICELFQNQTKKTPYAIAAIFEDTYLTYLELDHRSNQVANSLKRAGVKSETLVGLSLSPGFDILVGLLGILKSGGVYLPLDPSYQKERIRYMLDDAKPKILITDSSFLSHFKEYSCQIIQMSQIDFGCNTPPEAVEFKPQQLAYVIYTSGSTGKPKGIMVEHESASHAALAHTQFYPDKMVSLLSSGISFDPSLLIIFHTLVTGGTICIPNREELIDAEKGIDLIGRHSINYLLCVPSFYTMLLNKNRLMPSLQCVSLAGEAIPNSLPAEHARLAPNAFLYNEYGPTEYAIGTTIGTIVDPELKKIHEITIGKPLPNTKVVILDENQQPVKEGVRGEIFISGIGLARGYLNKPELTQEHFVKRSTYRTGDFGRFLPDGRIEFLGRMDRQVKILGHRIELSEIEYAICQSPGINEAVVIAWEDRQGTKKLLAYFSALEKNTDLTSSLKAYLANQLPKHMIPSVFTQMNEWPRTPNGKIDKAALSSDHAIMTAFFESPAKKASQPLNEIEQAILKIWKEVLQRNDFGIHDNFFELGGDSLQVAIIQTLLRDKLGRQLGMTKLFEFPTISLLAHHLSDLDRDIHSSVKAEICSESKAKENAIAVIGLSARFPGAPNVHAFWEHLCQGNETISTLPEDPRYVNRRGILADIEMFDADFFGMSPKEAEITDPQHRIFLECAWEALEMAGHSPDRYPGSIGVYGGTSRSSYFLHHLFSNEALMQALGDYQIRIGNESDFLTTRVSYKLNLKGPSLSIQTACSTSLVAICVACNHLLTHQCDLALAGGVSICIPQQTGYTYHQDMIFSPDGQCRPFDASAKGTVPSNGAGVVALKRLKDAERDGDLIYAVVRGCGMNNDGNEKMGYTAPSVQGQKKAIESAIAMAKIDPATINYIETHGTGTILGDPIEIEALTQAFGEQMEKQHCAIGSVKGNIGHTMEAAGVAGFIKAVLALHYKRWPASLHFANPNPNIDFQNSPFYVQSTCEEWTTTETTRRAGVSSFGFGGTNAHVILEEARKNAVSSTSVDDQLLVLSAKTPTALKQMALNLAHHLQQNPTLSLADVAYTLQTGRKEFKVKQAFICSNLQQAIDSLLTFREQASSNEFLRSLGEHWMQGGQCDWAALHPENRRRVPLPTYPFEKKRLWIDPPSVQEKEVPQSIKKELSMEETLIAIWKEILGTNSIRIDEDFYEIGGDSLSAIRVVSLIQEKMGIRLTTQTLLEHRTIAKLSPVLAKKIPSTSHLTLLKEGNGHPLFLVHPIEGNLFAYRLLVDRLSIPYPIYGIQATDNTASSIEEIAICYIKEIQKIQSQGPYRLFGMSFGGLIAYEIARRLQESGQVIEFLSMADIVKPDPIYLPLTNEKMLLVHLLELLEGKPVLSEEITADRIVQSLKLSSFPENERNHLQKRIINHLKLLAHYHPKPYIGNILYFQAKERFFRQKDLCLGSTWKSLISGTIDIKEVPGNHLTMMTAPHVDLIANQLNEHLKQ